jgi:hypothetical protein
MADRWAMDKGAGTGLTSAVSGVADGTLSGGTSWVAGLDGTGSALQVDGVGGLASIVSSANEQQDSMTVTFWARASSPLPDEELVALTSSDCTSPWSITTGTSGSFAFTAQMCLLSLDREVACTLDRATIAATEPEA